MTFGAEAIGGEALGAAVDELEALLAAGTPAAKRKARWIARRLKRAVRIAGEKVTLDNEAEVKELSAKAVIRTVDPNKPLVGDILLSDYSVIIPAKPLTDAGFKMDIGVMVWRFGLNERGLRIHVEPQLLGLDDEPLLYRCFARG
jgi:hypothetical protein